jgi:hypothetical protein
MSDGSKQDGVALASPVLDEEPGDPDAPGDGKGEPGDPDAPGDEQISDQASFDALTKKSHEVAGLYAYKYLDGLIELARAVGHDFFARPFLYTELADPAVAELLARVDARFGTDEHVLSRQQRQAIYTPLFDGDWQGQGQNGQSAGDFVKLRDGLLDAAAAFAEWSQATGIPMLRERVRTAHRPFKQYLTGLAGASVAWSRREALPALAEGAAHRILRDRGVIAVFGLTHPPQDAWPYREDANGDKVIEEIGKRLDPNASPPWTRQGFSAVQRVALRGAEALVAILDFDEVHGSDSDDQELDRLITRCYTWHAALKAC